VDWMFLEEGNGKRRREKRTEVGLVSKRKRAREEERTAGIKRKTDVLEQLSSLSFSSQRPTLQPFPNPDESIPSEIPSPTILLSTLLQEPSSGKTRFRVGIQHAFELRKDGRGDSSARGRLRR